MVGKPSLTRAALLRLAWAVSFLPLLVPDAAGQGLVASGACRDGEPNGAYELRMASGQLRVAGAFAKGRRTGTYVFWAENGARVAVIPYDNERKSGTIAVWFSPAVASTDAGRKSEAAYVDDRLHGVKRSWHPNGNPRTDLRYERGELVEARAWDEEGPPFSDAEARVVAERDLATDERFYATLESLVADHRPKCD